MLEVLSVMKLDIIRRPLITEKTTILREQDGRTSCSRWRRDANKIEVKRAVETLFGSRSPRCAPPSARQGQAPGPVRRPASGLEEGLGGLREGEKLTEFFEGA